MKKIIFTASECAPFIKTGGLGDVAGALPKYIDRKKYDIRVVIPKYLSISPELSKEFEFVNSFEMELGWRKKYVGVLKTVYDDITFYFIDNEEYFAGEYPYCEMNWDIEKFAFFSRAVLEIFPYIKFFPDIIHCNDWQTSMIPVFWDAFFKKRKYFKSIKTILTIHNLKFQGEWDLNSMQDITGLPDEYFTKNGLDQNGGGNYLKAGILYSDIVTTVSNTYASEIKTPFYGEGLNDVIIKIQEKLYGIINGLDFYEFDPGNDKYIYYKYNPQDYKLKKYKNKISLQKQLGLKEDKNIFMIGLVSRLTDQKGLDLIQCVIDEICNDDVQFVILGTGELKYEDFFKHYAWKYKEYISANIMYSEEMARKIYSASDAFLMPSLFEPCGLSQLISLRYGCVPIVRETGGLKDTVEAYNQYEGTGTGFSFSNYNAHEMLEEINKAKNIFYNKKRQWNKIIDNGMSMDYSWDSSAAKYEKLYDSL